MGFPIGGPFEPTMYISRMVVETFSFKDMNRMTERHTELQTDTSTDNKG